ncbi:MAG: response regulator, partial [bacterium]
MQLSTILASTDTVIPVVPLRVLLVDDIAENLLLLEEVLSDQGYDTVSVTSGAEAMQQLEVKPFHAIIADAMMPSMDGFQLCKEVKESGKYSQTPFIIYTGNYVDKEDQNFAKTIGVDAYVMKFDGLASLVQSVNDLTRRSGCASEAGAADLTLKDFIAPNIDGHTFLERHHAIIVKKLEEKMVELEMYAETLSRKNREIQASEARYRNLFEHASIGIFVLDRETGKILDVNGEALSLLGYSGDEMLTIEPLSFVQEEEVRQAILQSENYFSMEATFRRKDGAMVEVELGAGAFAEQNNSKILLYVLDITEQNKMRQHLLQSEKMAFMGRLAASIAHDIRNPLAAITLNLQYVSKRLPEDFKDKGSIDFALEGASRIGKVIENTLNLARVTPPQIRPESINNIVSTSASFL